ncbi:hypothetical protein OUZ56_005169 [Daphnia magna]|uniref:Uncharacterized protein n=1 Tax=Daphnia magna TaxID=35525 RepID=A0ABQ9YS11_9CRUS|nr:hypothetical protein OUZ56_005169 [Daphnia magna]
MEKTVNGIGFANTKTQLLTSHNELDITKYYRVRCGENGYWHSLFQQPRMQVTYGMKKARVKPSKASWWGSASANLDESSYRSL